MVASLTERNVGRTRSQPHETVQTVVNHGRCHSFFHEFTMDAVTCIHYTVAAKTWSPSHTINCVQEVLWSNLAVSVRRVQTTPRKGWMACVDRYMDLEHLQRVPGFSPFILFLPFTGKT